MMEAATFGVFILVVIKAGFGGDFCHPKRRIPSSTATGEFATWDILLHQHGFAIRPVLFREVEIDLSRTPVSHPRSSLRWLGFTT
jgi:hypothetical protein